MQTGMVRLFNMAKGCGFIQTYDRSKDLFVLAFALERSGVQRLGEGQKVSFDTETDARNGKLAVANIQAEISRQSSPAGPAS